MYFCLCLVSLQVVGSLEHRTEIMRLLNGECFYKLGHDVVSRMTIL